MSVVGKYVGNGELAGTIRALFIVGSIVVSVFYALDRVEKIVERQLRPVQIMIDRHENEITRLEAAVWPSAWRR